MSPLGTTGLEVLMKLTGLIVLAFLAVVMPSAAQGPVGHTDWAEGPEGFLLTANEREAWNGIANAAAAEKFIDLFWVRRDPNLSSRENEFRTEFDSRVVAADAEPPRRCCRQSWETKLP